MRLCCLRFTLQLGAIASVVVGRIRCPDGNYAALAARYEQVALRIVQTVAHDLFVAHKVGQWLEGVLGWCTDRSQDLTEKEGISFRSGFALQSIPNLPAIEVGAGQQEHTVVLQIVSID